jgi:hypothetical protein
MTTRLVRVLRTVYIAIPAAIVAASPVHADVTVEQKTTLDVASLIRMHGGTTTNVTADKQREDTESHCEGMMSLVCGNVKSGEIVRLDRGVTWRLQPDKKTYREEVFATPEEIAEMRAKMQAALEKMRSCPVSQKQQPIDKSKCEMSPPKIDVHKTDDKATIAGHDAQRTLATLTETCTNKDTGDVCDTVVAIDVWLTQDTMPGAADRRAFAQAYARKLGLDDVQGPLRGEFAKFLAPYQSQIKQLTDKSSDLKGQPLKTSLRVLMGGQQCSATAKMNDNASPNGDSSPAPNPLGDVGQAGKAIGSMLGGLFHKKKTDDSDAASSAAPSAAAPASSATPSSDPYSQYYAQLATFTMETVTINTDSIPSDRFEVPPGWTKEVPPPSKKGDSDFTCPKTGS